MAFSIRNLSAFILLALVAPTAVFIAYSAGEKPAPENPLVAQENSAVVAEEPAAALPSTNVAEEPAASLKAADVSKEIAAAAPEGPRPAPRGPVLLPPNPPYLNAPIENQLPALTLESVEDQTPQGPQDSRDTQADEVEAERPAEEEPEEDAYVTEMGPYPYAQPSEEPVQDGGLSQYGQPSEEEPSVEKQVAVEDEPTGQAEKEADEEPAMEDGPAMEDEPNEAADVASQEQTPQVTLPKTLLLPEPAPEPKPELTPAQATLRDRLRRILAFHRAELLSAAENTATEVMHSCLAFGCDTQLYRNGSSGQKVNGITCLCWNYPCAGYELLGLSEGRVAARIGYGLQEHPSELLAVLALSRVQATYPVRVGDDVRTVADLVEYEKLSCRSGGDLSLKLIGLAYYLDDEPTWQDSLGEDWSLERIVAEELDQPILGAACGGTHRLMGLGCALALREKQGQPIEGQFDRARKLIDQYHDYALKVQNPDGSWGPGFLAAQRPSRNQDLLRSTGHVLEWLALSLPEDRLDDPRLVRSIDYLHRLLGSGRYGRNVRSLSTREIGAVMHALHALVVYDERFLTPRTPHAS